MKTEDKENSRHCFLGENGRPLRLCNTQCVYIADWAFLHCLVAQCSVPKGILEGEKFLFIQGNLYFVVWKCFIYSNFLTGMIKIIGKEVVSSLLSENVHTVVPL